ncbi:uncharacterized protein BCR38DRAFT_159774 [Pseudomassariella vexata]|uniref:Uncharacterized protein n=1 Tax=Pseudomassariella vexata TaxID=1141098 RepID=A0A1Y2E8D0_9PEZI|nr:uncharacterized protein BCR38DRAFT_159774 [Pseudomassariella vexata]ORY67536.1 hypothetical protein BCR38DRAFT_159774 [Pseudomassariella vexata]
MERRTSLQYYGRTQQRKPFWKVSGFTSGLIPSKEIFTEKIGIADSFVLGEAAPCSYYFCSPAALDPLPGCVAQMWCGCCSADGGIGAIYFQAFCPVSTTYPATNPPFVLGVDRSKTSVGQLDQMTANGFHTEVGQNDWNPASKLFERGALNQFVVPREAL